MHNTPPLLSAFPPSLLFFNSFHPSSIFSLTYHLSCLTVISLSVFSLLSAHILLFCHSTFSSLSVALSVFSIFLPSSSLLLLSPSFRFTFPPSSFHFSFFLWGVIIWCILCVFDFSSAQEAVTSWICAFLLTSYRTFLGVCVFADIANVCSLDSVAVALGATWGPSGFVLISAEAHNGFCLTSRRSQSPAAATLSKAMFSDNRVETWQPLHLTRLLPLPLPPCWLWGSEAGVCKQWRSLAARSDFLGCSH